MAVPLTEYLNGSGSYDGFDVVRPTFGGAGENLLAASPVPFRARGLRQRGVQPRGRIDAREFRFPWPDASFDFAFATSLFTHLLPAAAENYFSEIARTLAPDGRLYFTAFLVNERSRGEMERGRTSYLFPHQVGAAYTQNPKSPESAIAYGEGPLTSLLLRAGLKPLRRPSQASEGGRARPFLPGHPARPTSIAIALARGRTRLRPDGEVLIPREPVLLERARLQHLSPP